jgi:predicted Holliday junction resolvase-like endonuclease
MRPNDKSISYLTSEIAQLRSSLALSEEHLQALRDNYAKLHSQKKSSEVRLGFAAEKLAPIMAEFPYQEESDEVYHMGMPVDYFIVRANELVIAEFKTGGAVLSERQRLIKKHIANNAVRFEEHRLSGEGYKIK